ncbi:MAG: M42 family metallopeptidase [Chloroflexi bacterium]|nr:M42 family metallopeptidase [Chloroflexota bacterium]
MMPEFSVNVEAMTGFLVGLLNTPSPTGYHVEAIAYTRDAFAALDIPGLTLSTTRKGALLAVWKGQADTARRGVTAHLDTLGLMVREIKANGRLKTSPLGGIMWGGIEMEGVTVRTHDNRRYRGTVVPVNPSVHVNPNIQKQERNADTMEIRLDARTASADETRALGIEVGDFIFVDPRVEVSDTGFIRGRFLDDKASVACIYGALRALKEAGLQPAQDTAFLIANYEEVGHGGAAGWPFELDELLAVDMGAIGESQNSDEFSVSICVKDGGGPYHFDMTNKLRRLASEHNIPFKTDIYVFYSSDGTAFWRAGGDARVGLIGPGVDGSHAYERTHRDALEGTARLLAYYLLDGSQ